MNEQFWYSNVLLICKTDFDIQSRNSDSNLVSSMPEVVLEALRPEVLMDGPASEDFILSSSEDLEDCMLWWASLCRRLEDSDDQVPKTLKTEVLRNVSRILGLEVLMIKASEVLTLIKASWRSLQRKSTRKYCILDDPGLFYVFSSIFCVLLCILLSHM